MALPQFIKAGVPTVTLSKEYTFPDVSPKIMNQFIGISDANTVQVAIIGAPLTTIMLSFQQLTTVDRDNLEAFFANPLVYYSKYEFTFVDAHSVSHNVRFLEPQFALPLVSHNNVSFEMVLTKV